MKCNRILTAVLLVLLLALAVTVCASASEIRPIPVDHDQVDLENGEFCLEIKNADRIEPNGFFIAVLYLEDRYDGDQIRSLAPGDTVYANDEKWTVQEVVVHSDGEAPDEPATYEIYTGEELDGYLAFAPREDGTFVAVINDWNPVVLLGSVQVRLPLPDAFEFITWSAGEENEPKGMDEFVSTLDTFGQESFNAYNTTCVFKDGMLVRVTNYAYPQGPEEDDSANVPVWKFCHGLRDGLDTAVITGYQTDCEEGLIPIEMTPEEIEDVRRIAMNGMITGKVSDEMRTGGTWVYVFETPGGKHLLSIEMFGGMIAGSEGMYSYDK